MNIKELTNLTVCSPPKKESIERTRNSCGVDKLDELFDLFEAPKDQEVKWYKWMDTVVPGNSN